MPDGRCPWERPRQGFLSNGGTRRMAYEWAMKGSDDWSKTGFRSARFACGDAQAERLKNKEVPYIKSKDGSAVYRRIDRGGFE